MINVIAVLATELALFAFFFSKIVNKEEREKSIVRFKEYQFAKDMLRYPNASVNSDRIERFIQRMKIIVQVFDACIFLIFVTLLLIASINCFDATNHYAIKSEDDINSTLAAAFFISSFILGAIEYYFDVYCFKLKLIYE
jgi:hypothetical protein